MATSTLANQNLVGKRKKRLEPLPNPLFTQWLTEWKAEAQEKGWKSHYIYSRALKSLSKYPLPLESGKDCKILQNFGDKICKMLDDRLAKYRAENPESEGPPPAVKKKKNHFQATGSASSTTTAPSQPKVQNFKGRYAAGSKPSREATPSLQRNIGVVHTLSDSEEERNQDTPPPTQIPNVREIHSLSDSDGSDPPARRPTPMHASQRGSREYIPAYRSGAYALLVALYRNTQSEDDKCFLTKVELIEAAQPFTDAPFVTVSSDPSSRYTAWSSMGTLIRKSLVIKQSSPAKYSLTDAGCELARRLEAVGDCGTGVLQDGARTQLSQSVPACLPAGELQASGTTSVCSNHGNMDLIYWYVAEDGTLVRHKDQAVVLLDDDASLGFLVKCNYRLLLQSEKSYRLDTTRPLGEDVHVYLSDADAAEVATAFTVGSGLMPGEPRLPTDDSMTQPGLELPALARLPPKRAAPRKKTGKGTEIGKEPPSHHPSASHSHGAKPSGHALTVQEDSDEDVLFVGDAHVEKTTLTSVPAVASTSTAQFAAPEVPLALDAGSRTTSRADSSKSSSQTSKVSSLSRALEDCHSQDSVVSSVASIASSTTSTSTLPTPDFTLLPGTFEIVLCIDNREFYGSKSCSKNLLPDLVRNGVNCDLRELQVGDILWVAREKIPTRPGVVGKPQGRELVLNYIVERKRMDDFVSSILDGRLRDQKFRLKHCGLQTAIFLIEQHGSMKHFSISEERLKQAIANTQVIDGFKVKQVGSGQETVTYLTLMTRYLHSHFKDKTLHACSLDALQEFPSSFRISQEDHYLVPFPHFNKASVKSKLLSVQEMFGKQLIQLHGMSAEKARAVLEQYPTPAHLTQAFDACRSDKEKESLLSTIKSGKANRSLGISQSRQIFQLYCTHRPLT